MFEEKIWEIDGDTDDVIALGDLKAKFEAFGWKVFECDGNNLDDLLKTMAEIPESLTTAVRCRKLSDKEV